MILNTRTSIALVILYFLISAAFFSLSVFNALTESGIYEIESLPKDALKSLILAIGPAFFPLLVLYIKSRKK